MNYDEYALLFDKVFPLNDTTLAFLKKEFAHCKTILDVACGRGLYTDALSAQFNVEGIDISPQMIASAKAQFPRVKFCVKDMRCLDGVYDGIFIIGNSLVHLNSLEEIANECRHLFRHMTAGGKLVIQIINYDRIYKYKIGKLPEINRDGISFVREYDLKENEVVFRSTLICGESVHKQSVLLYPLKCAQLTELLAQSGFTNIRLWDGFTEKEFLPDTSMQLVVTAEKQTDKK